MNERLSFVNNRRPLILLSTFIPEQGGPGSRRGPPLHGFSELAAQQVPFSLSFLFPQTEPLRRRLLFCRLPKFHRVLLRLLQEHADDRGSKRYDRRRHQCKAVVGTSNVPALSRGRSKILSSLSVEPTLRNEGKIAMNYAAPSHVVTYFYHRRKVSAPP